MTLPVSDKRIRFDISQDIFNLMNVMLKTLATVHAEYHREVTKTDEQSMERDRAIGNMLLMIDLIDAPEATIGISLRNQEDRDALKGMLIDGRKLREHMGPDIGVEETEVEKEVFGDIGKIQ